MIYWFPLLKEKGGGKAIPCKGLVRLGVYLQPSHNSTPVVGVSLVVPFA